MLDESGIELRKVHEQMKVKFNAETALDLPTLQLVDSRPLALPGPIEAEIIGSADQGQN